MLPCTEEEVEALLYFISNLYLTLYPIRTLSIPFPNFTAVHGVGVAQAKLACKHTIATRKCYQYNTIQVGAASFRFKSLIDNGEMKLAPCEWGIRNGCRRRFCNGNVVMYVCSKT